MSMFISRIDVLSHGTFYYGKMTDHTPEILLPEYVKMGDSGSAFRLVLYGTVSMPRVRGRVQYYCDAKKLWVDVRNDGDKLIAYFKSPNARKVVLTKTTKNYWLYNM